MVAELLDIDGDATTLRMIREQSPGVLPTPQLWIELGPNTCPRMQQLRFGYREDCVEYLIERDLEQAALSTTYGKVSIPADLAGIKL